MPETNAHGQPVGDPLPDWTPRRVPESVVLQGRHVTLAPLTTDDADWIVAELTPHPSLWTYRPDDPPRSPAEAAGWIADRIALPLTMTYAVRRHSDDRHLGMCSLMRTDAANGVTEIGAILFAPDLQRTPASTEVTHLIARYVFDELGYRRLEWKCDSLNEPSRRAAARLGFTYEGRFRDHMVVRGRTRDTDWFAMTAQDWPAIRAAHERWLDPVNFDPDGRQLSPLVVRSA